AAQQHDVLGDDRLEHREALAVARPCERGGLAVRGERERRNPSRLAAVERDAADLALRAWDVSDRAAVRRPLIVALERLGRLHFPAVRAIGQIADEPSAAQRPE